MIAPENPFEAPQGDVDPRYRPSTDPSVDAEPHMLSEDFPTAPAHGLRTPQLSTTDDEAVDHTVWDEPALSPSLAARPSGALTYASWLTRKIATTSRNLSWMTTAAAAMLSGVAALLASFLLAAPSYHGFVHSALVVPLTEEILKLALVVWIVERRPYLFKSAVQILLVTAASGFVFALLENVYLAVTASVTPAPFAFRWIFGILLHVGCSVTAGIGLIQIWRDCIEHRRKPRLHIGAAWLLGAIAVHVLYNSFAVLAALTAYLV